MKNIIAYAKRNQRGAILITLIVAIVIIGLSGVAMLYYSTTSAYGELFANRQQRAYYVAESGGNYALQKYLADGTLYSESTPFIVTLSNGEQFRVSSKIESKGTPAADWIVIKSRGIVGSDWLTTRQLVTKEIKKALATPPGMPPVMTDDSGVPIGFNTNPVDKDLDTTWTLTPGTVAKIADTGPSKGQALTFKNDVGSIDINPSIVNLYSAWNNNGNLLSYFTQVKVNVDSQGKSGNHYLLGLTFRKGSNNSNNNFYGISFYRSNGLNDLPDWCTTAFTGFIPNTGQVYTVLWKNSGGTKTVLAYALMDHATYGVVTDATNKVLAVYPTLMIRVNERFDGLGGTRRNHLKAYVMGPTGSTTLNWSLGSFKQITWTAVQALNPSTQSAPLQEIIEDTFTSTGFTADRTEIGVHAHYDSNAFNDQFFKDFGTAVQGTTGGSSQY